MSLDSTILWVRVVVTLVIGLFMARWVGFRLGAVRYPLMSALALCGGALGGFLLADSLRSIHLSAWVLVGAVAGGITPMAVAIRRGRKTPVRDRRRAAQ